MITDANILTFLYFLFFFFYLFVHLSSYILANFEKKIWDIYWSCHAANYELCREDPGFLYFSVICIAYACVRSDSATHNSNTYSWCIFYLG